MTSYRITLSHMVREQIVVDVEAPDLDTVKQKLGDIHAHACEMEGWCLAWPPNATDLVTDIAEETADHFDRSADGQLKITPEGVVEFVSGKEETE